MPEQTTRSARGKIVINRDVCKGCAYCVSACPKGCIEMDKTINSAGYFPAVFVHADKCTGCAICATVCPDIAIQVWRD
ncbi:MAG: 4Fe-4S binding protein [Dissulfurispiraceae bacterium]|jgi:2-oxoglutarate ferredoxin oxidoreductase subunit delta|nr:4Fe-4S binding protein [Dissulfurispiraceae bacterium]